MGPYRGKMILFGNNGSPIVPQQKHTISTNGTFFTQSNSFHIAHQQPGIGGRDPTSHIRTLGAPAFDGSTSGLPVIRAPLPSTVFVLSGVS